MTDLLVIDMNFTKGDKIFKELDWNEVLSIDWAFNLLKNLYKLRINNLKDCFNTGWEIYNEKNENISTKNVNIFNSQLQE